MVFLFSGARISDMFEKKIDILGVIYCDSILYRKKTMVFVEGILNNINQILQLTSMKPPELDENTYDFI